MSTSNKDAQTESENKNSDCLRDNDKSKESDTNDLNKQLKELCLDEATKAVEVMEKGSSEAAENNRRDENKDEDQPSLHDKPEVIGNFNVRTNIIVVSFCYPC